jgi:hypothetical protein
MDADFRSSRRKLPPEAFALGPKTEPEPSDLIGKDTWGFLIHLPDDVSIRTSNYHGTLLKRAYDVWGGWVSLTLDLQSLTTRPRDDALCLGWLTAGDELQASTYAMMTGYYRQAIAGLRSALEAVFMGVYFRQFPDPKKFERWADGHEDGRMWFGKAREALAESEPFSLFNDLQAELASLMRKRGWVDFQYATLSGFSHGRPFYVNRFGAKVPSTNVELWGGSNGPVYEPRSVRLWTTLFFDVSSLLLLLVGLTEPRLMTLTKPTDLPYAEYLVRVLNWHPALPSVAIAAGRYLLSGELVSRQPDRQNDTSDDRPW